MELPRAQILQNKTDMTLRPRWKVSVCLIRRADCETYSWWPFLTLDVWRQKQFGLLQHEFVCGIKWRHAIGGWVKWQTGPTEHSPSLAAHSKRLCIIHPDCHTDLKATGKGVTKALKVQLNAEHDTSSQTAVTGDSVALSRGDSPLPAVCGLVV